MLNYVRNLSKSGSFSARFISETKLVTPNFFIFLAQVTHYLTAVKNIKKSIEGKIFPRTSLNHRHCHFRILSK